jgi:glycosyltransferase involved in cell wall biosynthesis
VIDERASARVYANLRSAHLERFAEMAPASVFFQATRYDYDASLVPAGVVLRQLTRRGAIAELARTPYRVVEVNEPLTTNRWFDVLAQIVAVRLRARRNRRPQRVVAYCIGNADPALEVSRRWRLPMPVARLVSRMMVRVLVSNIDRLAFGTTGSREMYGTYAGRGLLAGKSRTFEALPAACACLDSSGRHAPGTDLVFVGAFDDHKGIGQVLAAWDEIRIHRPELRLRLVGKGRLVDDVERWAASRPEVSLDLDPPRSRIHDVLSQSTALILPSQRRGSWREQIGLPILEGLAHGCEIITTTETGLADWLSAKGHAVLEPGCSTKELAAAVVRALDGARERAVILADLPTVDARIEADRWLMN